MKPDEPKSDLERASDEVDQAWRELFKALRASPPGRLFERFADWLLTLGKDGGNG